MNIARDVALERYSTLFVEAEHGGVALCVEHLPSFFVVEKTHSKITEMFIVASR